MTQTKSQSAKKQIPIGDEVAILHLPSTPPEKPYLLGGKCKDCGEIFFPRQSQCPKCYSESVQEIPLSHKGKVYSATVVYLPPSMYKGPVPYGMGHVELPEGVLVPTALALTADKKPLKIGTDVELTTAKLEEDEEGNDIIYYLFKPV